MTDVVDRARAHFAAGNAHFEAGRFDAALVEFDAALAWVPGRPSVLANRGVTLCRLARWPEAVSTLEAALGADPDHADAWAALGLAQEALGRWADAVTALQRGLALGLRSAPLSLSLAVCLLRLAQALELFAALGDQLVVVRGGGRGRGGGVRSL